MRILKDGNLRLFSGKISKEENNQGQVVKFTYDFEKSATCTSITAPYAEAIGTSEHSPSFGVDAVKTGFSSQWPVWLLITMARNCNGILLNGVTLPKFVVPAGKSSKVNATTNIPPTAACDPLYVRTQAFCKGNG